MRILYFRLGLVVVLAFFAAGHDGAGGGESRHHRSEGHGLKLLPGLRGRGLGKAVGLEKAQARVESDDAKTSSDKLVAAIGLLGFKARLLQVAPAG